MSHDDRRSDPQPARALPAGYRQGVISAITVLLGFSLLFLRYWSFEAPGEWSVAAVLDTLLLGLAIVLELIALWRSLQLEDDEEREYRKTLRWLLASIVALLISLLFAALTTSNVIKF
jgi:heme A synthase